MQTNNALPHLTGILCLTFFLFAGLSCSEREEAHDAVPYASLPIKNVRERFLQWRGKDIKELEGAIQLFLEKKPAILAACNDFSALDAAIRADIVQYLESFFVQLEEPERLELALRK